MGNSLILNPMEVAQEKIEPGIGANAYVRHIQAVNQLRADRELLLSLKKKATKTIDAQLADVDLCESLLLTEIQDSLVSDPAVTDTETGGKKIELQDVGSASLTKVMSDYVIEDEEAVEKELGEKFMVVKRMLNKRMVTDYLKSRDMVIKGVSVKQSRRLTIK
jgi:hypothetical protein